MKLLKKIFKGPIALVFMLALVMSTMLTACGDPYQNVKVVLPDSVTQGELVMELDDNNTATSVLPITVEGAPNNVSKEVKASSTSERVTVSTEFVRGNVSNLTITVSGIVNNVQVTVTALDGQKSSSFYVSSIKRVTNLQQSSDLTVAYTVLNTPKTLTNELIAFTPSDTTEKDIEFSLPDGVVGASIENNVLLVTDEYISDNDTIEVIATSKTNPQVTTRVTLKIIEPIEVSQTYFYANIIPMEEIIPEQNASGYYELKIANNLQSKNSILINISANSADYIITPKFKYGNIAEVVASQITGTTYSFTIKPKGSVGSDELTFEVKHADYNEKITTEKLIISAYDTVSTIRTYKDGALVEDVSAFDVYDFYANVRGLELRFEIGPTTVPEGDRGLTVELETGAYENYTFYDANGNVITPTQNAEGIYTFDTVSGATIYVTANQDVTASSYVTVVSKANSDVSIRFRLDPKVGAKQVAFGNAILEDDGTYSYYLTSNQAMTKQVEFLVAPTNINLGEVSVIPSGNAFEVVSDTPRYLGTTVVNVNGEDITFNRYSIEIVSKTGFEEVGELRIRLSNGQLLRANVEVFKAMDESVSISVPSPQVTSVIGNVRDAVVDGQDVFVASIKRGNSVNLNIEANTSVSVTYDFAQEIFADDYDVYSSEYQDAFLANLPTDFVNTSTILNALYLNNYNQLIVSGEGKVLVRAKISGYILDTTTGQKVSKDVYRYFVIESYIPITSMLLSRSSATLYSEDSVGDANLENSKLTFNLVFNNGDSLNQPTYDKLTWFIQNNEYGAGEHDITITYRSENITDTRTLYTVTFSQDLKQVSISAKSTYELTSGGLAIANVITDSLLARASEFNSEVNRSFLLTIRKANKVENIILDNVTVETGIYLEIERDLEDSQDQQYDINAHADTSNNPLNTNLIYEFIPNDGTSSNVITLNRTTGLVTLSRNQTIGGSGYIRVAPEDSYIGGRYVPGDVDVAKYIPITIADGRSRETSYRISNIDTLRTWIQTYPELYYTLTIDVIELNEAITTPLDTLDGNTVVFTGGLFGKLVSEETCHTLLINGISLFTVLGENAVIEDITLIGQATQGFVAQENRGTIRNITVDTWSNGDEYLPSTVTQASTETITGGIVAINSGTISNVKFYGSIENTNATSYVGGIAGLNTGSIEHAEVEFYRYSNSISNYNGTTVGGLVGQMTAGTLNYSYAYSYVKPLQDGEGNNIANSDTVLTGTNIGALVGEILGGNVNASFAKVNTSNFVGNSSGLSYLQNAYIFTNDIKNPYKIIANYSEIATPSTYPDLKNVYKDISFGSNQLWNFSANVNNGYPYFNAIMQDAELDDISEFNILNTDLTLTDDNGNVIFFYYEANGMTLTDMENAVLASWNSVNFTSLFGVTNTSSIRITVGDAPIFAGSNYISIQDVLNGSFTFSVFSKYDYTLKKDFNATIIYKISDYTLSYYGTELGSSTDISIKYGSSDVVSTSISTSRIATNRAINLTQNDITVEASISGNTGLIVDGTQIGVHNILTAGMENFVQDPISVSLTLNVANLNNIFKAIITENFTKQFRVQLFNGADAIEPETDELSIEPVDSFAQTVDVTLYTDNNDIHDLVASVINDEKLKADGYSDYNGVTIITDHRIEDPDDENYITQSPYYAGITNIDIYDTYREFTNGYVVVRIENPSVIAYTDKTMSTIVSDITSDTAKYFKQTYKVSFGIVDDNAIRSRDFNGKLFEILLYADSTGVSTQFDLTVETQKLSYINTTHYSLDTALWGGTGDNQRLYYTYDNIPESLLAPGKEGLLNVELYPAYSNYSYIEITTRTVLGSSYQVRLGLMEKVDGSNSYIRKTTGYETITNGIRVFNPNLANSIGSLYLRTFIPSSIDEDSTYEITIIAYNDNSDALKTDTFMLSVQHVAKPELTVNGSKQAIIPRGGSGEVTITVNADQNIDSLTINGIESGNASYDPLTYTIDETTGLKHYTTTVYLSSDLVAFEGNNYITISAETTRTINGTVERATDTVYVAVVDFVINTENTQLKTDAFNKDVLTLYVGTTQKLEFDFDIDFYLTNDSLNSFYNYNYYNSNPQAEDQTGNYIVNGFYDSMPYDFDYDSSNSTVLANFIDNLYYADTYNLDRIELSKVFNRESGQVSSNNFCAFTFDGSDLYVRGLQATNTSLEMLLRIPIQIPNGTDEPTKTYLEYYFTIDVVLETNEDKPIIIDTAEKFNDLRNATEPLDYILTEDIYLLDYEPFSTSGIRSLDGNNKTIHILSYAIPTEEAPISLALFDEVTEDTTLKNVRVNTFYGGKIDLNMTNVTSVDIAGFAITNNGTITNCEVVSYSYTGADRPVPDVPGLTVNYGYSSINVENVHSRVAGFVINNENGSITNSRVGGTSLEIANGTAITPTVFNIVAQGNVAGFVYENSGTIASSFFMNGTITNQTSSGSDTSTAGFAVSNNGTIRLSYARGVYASDSEIHATGGGIETASVAAGFVYENGGTVEDSYSNIMLTTIGDKESGRLSAGFVYINNTNGVVRRSYSASRIENSNSTQMNFLGVDVNLDLQNYGLVENCYYYNSDTSLDDEYAASDMESLYDTSVNRVLDPDVRDSFYGFAFSNSSVVGYTSDGVWYMTSRGPELVSANNIAVSSRILVVEETNAEGEIVDYSFSYADGYRYGSSKNPIIIRDETEFNQVFGGDTANVSSSVAYYYDLVENKVYGNYRIVNDIDLTNLLSDETGLTLRSTEMSLTPTYSNQNEINGLGLLDGNGFTISGIELVSTLGGSNTSYGLFKELENGAVVMNLNLEIEGVNATGVNYVGALAGTVTDSRVINVSVSSGSADQNAVIYGYNIAGGVVGRVVGDSYLSNISVENLTVIAGNDVGAVEQQFYNRVIRNNISYAGGVAGVIDIYTNVNDYRFSSGLSDPNVVALKASGNMNVYGATVGGIVGFLGPQTMLQDALFEISSSQDNYSQKLIAYKFSAGGIVGENYGYLFMVRSEHSSEDQLAIENGYSTYYNNPSETVNRGNLTLFEYEDNTNYTPKYIGGIVGEFVTGRLEKSYSKLNVRSSVASYAGGIIGGITGRDNSALGGLEDYGNAQTLSLSFIELYSTGDLLASEGAGGIFGYIEEDVWNKISLEKINALNYLSVPTTEGTASGEYSIIDGKAYINNVYDIYYMPEDSGLINITLNQTNYDVHALEGFTVNDTTYYFNNSRSSGVTATSGNIISEAVQKVSELKNSNNADYSNEMSKIFRNAGWDQEYWFTETDTDVPHLFPHLTFRIEPSVIYIREASDLEYLQLYKNKTFIIIGQDGDGIVQVGDWLATTRQGFTVAGFSGLLRGRDDSGNYGLDFTVTNSTNLITSPLFESTYTGAQFSNFVIKGMGASTGIEDAKPNINAILVESATGTTFDNITIEDCSIAPTMSSGLSEAYNVGLLVGSASRCSFSNISFEGTNNEIDLTINYDNVPTSNFTVSVGMVAGNIGASTSSSSTMTVVSGIKFGAGATSAYGSNINIAFTGNTSTEKPLTLNVGHIAGSTGGMDLDLVNYEEYDNFFNLRTKIDTQGKNLIDTLNAGGLFGITNGILEANLLQRDANQNNLLINFRLDGDDEETADKIEAVTAKFASVGGLFGRITGSTNSQFTVEAISLDNPTFRYYVNNEIYLNITGVEDSTSVSGSTNNKFFFYGGAIGRVDGSILLNNIQTEGTTTINSSALSYVGGVVGYVGQRFNATNLISGNNVNFTQNSSVTAKNNIFGGIVAVIDFKYGSVDILDTTISSITSSLNESLFNVSSKDLFYGGFVGLIPEQNASNNTQPLLKINNSVSGGGLEVGDELTVNSAKAGGLVGSLDGNSDSSTSNTANIDISSNVVYTDLQFKIKPTNIYLGGIIGIGVQGAQLYTNYSLASIIYPYARTSADNIGVIAGSLNGTTNNGGMENYYSNQLSLMTASDSEVEANSLKATNISYGRILEVVTSTESGLGVSNLITSAHFGSKLNPFYVKDDSIEINLNGNRQPVARYNENTWAIENNKDAPESIYNTYLGSAGDDPFSTKTVERKYFKVETSTDSTFARNLYNLNLENSAIFGDGTKIQITSETPEDGSSNYIANTFINELDSDSFVTGVSVLVDTRANNDSAHFTGTSTGTGENQVNTGTVYYAGLVGINEGIVYACNSINSTEASDDPEIEPTKGLSGGISVNNIPATIVSDLLTYDIQELVVGGLVAINEATGYISESFSMVDIVTDDSVIDNAYLGGLVGKNRGQIDSCYSTGYIQSNLTSPAEKEKVYSFSYDESSATVANSYTIAKAKSRLHNSATGVFGVGANSSNYYDKSATENTTKENKPKENTPKALTVDQMSAYTVSTDGTSFSINTEVLTATTTNNGVTVSKYLSPVKFAQDPSINYGYPYFGGTAYTSSDSNSEYMEIDTGDGTQNNPFQIPSAGKWQQLTKAGDNSASVTIGTQTKYMYSWSANYELVYDIDFTNTGITSVTAVGTAQKTGSISDADHNYFIGSFNGNNKTISHITIANSSENAVGLFGYVGETGTNPTFVTIENVIVANSTITAKKADASTTSAGSIVGIGRNLTITNCHSVNNNVTAFNNAGGIVGSIIEGNVLIEQCSNTGSSGKIFSNGKCTTDIPNTLTTAGGILGYVIDRTGDENTNIITIFVTIEECYNTGNIVAGQETTTEANLPLYAYAGGILGTAGIYADYGENNGEVPTETLNVAKYVTINNAYNKGSVLSNATVPTPTLVKNYKYQTDSDGNTLYDGDGNPMIALDENKNPIYEVDYGKSYKAMYLTDDNKIAVNNSYSLVSSFYMLERFYRKNKFGNYDWQFSIYMVNIHILTRESYSSGIGTNCTINACYNIGQVKNNEESIDSLAKQEAQRMLNDSSYRSRLDISLGSMTRNAGEESAIVSEDGSIEQGQVFNMIESTEEQRGYINDEELYKHILDVIVNGHKGLTGEEVVDDVAGAVASVSVGILIGSAAVVSAGITTGIIGTVALGCTTPVGIVILAVGAIIAGAIYLFTPEDQQDFYILYRSMPDFSTRVEINDIYGTRYYYWVSSRNVGLTNSDCYTSKDNYKNPNISTTFINDYKDSNVAPLGYFSSISSSYFLENKYYVRSISNSAWNYGKNNLGGDTNSKRTIEQLTLQENEEDSVSTYENQTVINYSYISEDSINGYYFYYLEEDEMSISKDEVSSSGNDTDKKYVLVSHMGQQYLYYNEIYDVGYATEQSLKQYAWQLDGQINKTYSVDDYVVIKMPTEGNSDGILISNDNSDQSFIKIYYKNESDLIPVYEIDGDPTSRITGYTITNPYVVIYEREVTPEVYENPVHVRLADEITITVGDDGLYEDANMINHRDLYAGMFKLKGTLPSAQTTLTSLRRVQFSDITLAQIYQIPNQSSDSYTNLYIGKILDECYTINFDEDEGRAYFTLNSGFNDSNIAFDGNVLYVYNQGSNGDISTITINPNYLFPEGEDITENAFVLRIYRDDQSNNKYIIGFYRSRKISADENVAKIDRENKTITVNYWSIGNDTSPWAIDPAINDGLPYLKNLPIEFSYIDYDVATKEYSIYTTPIEAEGKTLAEGESFVAFNDGYRVVDDTDVPYIGYIQNGDNITYVVYYDETNKKYWTSWEDFNVAETKFSSDFYTYSSRTNGLLFLKLTNS